MISKKKVLETVKEMPEEFSIDDLMERLLVLNKIEVGLKQAERGETYTAEEAKKLMREWSK